MNTKFNSLLVVFTILFFSSNILVAQDIIHLKKEGEVVEAKVVEVAAGEIKYKLWSEREDGIVYIIDKTTISHIEFANGRTEYFGQELMDIKEYYEGQKKRAIKISFLGPLVEYTNLGFEYSIKPGRSLEAKASFIGFGFNESDRNPNGFIGAIGYKLYKKPTYVTSDQRRRHILQGGYFKPEIFAGRTTFNDGVAGTGDRRESSTAFGFLLNVGYQWVISNAVLIDFGIGLGYGDGHSYRAYRVWSNNLTSAFTLDVGYAF